MKNFECSHRQRVNSAYRNKEGVGLRILAYQGIYKPQSYRNGAGGGNMRGGGVFAGATRYAHPPSSSSYLAGAAGMAPPRELINGW